MLVPGRKHGEALLFCRERDPEREAWDGPRAGPEGAVDAFGMDDAYPIADLDDILPGLLEGRSRVYYHFGRDTEFDLKLIGWVNRVRAQVRQGAQPPHEFLELGHLLHELRLFKARDELKLMQRAADISMRGARWRRCAPRAPASASTRCRPSCSACSAPHDADAAYEPASSAPAPTPACCTTAPTTRRRRTATWCWSTPAPNTRGYAVRHHPHVSGQRPLHARSSARCTTWSARRRPRRWRRRGPACPTRPATTPPVETLTEGLLTLGLLKGTLEKDLADGELQALLQAQDRALARPGRARRRRIPHRRRIRACSSRAWSSRSSPASTSRPTTRGVAAKWRGIGIRIEDDVLITPRRLTEVLTDALAPQRRGESRDSWPLAPEPGRLATAHRRAGTRG